MCDYAKIPLPIFQQRDFVLNGVFRRGKNPSVLPREEKRAERQKSRASLVRAERLLKKKNLL